jgi:hypothetical protein
MPAGRLQSVRIGWIHTQEDGIASHGIVEPAGQGLEEGIATGPFVQRRPPGHVASMADDRRLAVAPIRSARAADGMTRSAGGALLHSMAVGRSGAGWWSCRVAGVLATATAILGLAACGGGNSSAAAAANQVFLSEVHVAAPDVSSYRSDVQLERLGHAACDGFRSGASYEELADRLPLLEGRDPLPSGDLGAVINGAVGAYCPQYRTMIQ